MRGALHAADALLPDGWAREVLLEWDDDGVLTTVRAAASPAGAPRASGPVLPGMPNLHSHAFQRAFAGLTEFRGAARDSFWSWRTLMYRFATRLAPADVEAIATWLYIEMLEAGYTSVCEFHYVHHDADGRPYADDAEMSLALLRAARASGIGLTLLPVLYQASNFGGAAPLDAQRRFVRSTESMLRLLERLLPACRAQGAALGVAPHSLRAVPPDALREIVAGVGAIDAAAPIHIHVAEQRAEVDACVAWSGRRPLAWLLDHAPVDSRWCLVHATHLDADEHRRAAASGAVAGLCPSTEANLGDGLFDLDAWRAGGGRWGIGSDSHACVDAAEELMLLEYGQRLRTLARNVLATDAQPSVAAAMTLAAVQGGAQAAARPIGGLRPGQRADLVELDPTCLPLAGLAPPQMLDAHVFASHRGSAIDRVRVGGRVIVDAGRHLGVGGRGLDPDPRQRALAAAAFVDARRRLAAA
ncbi:MAG: formimidoylglutamate deiminase [Lautropia sp.]